MKTSAKDLFQKTSFCTCSYLKSPNQRRASIVREAIQTWDKFLDIPFAERIFLDDGSPNANGINLLKSSNTLNKFDEVRYNTLAHPPHSNFGIVYSMNLCQSEYILHLDDDINITTSYDECFNFLQQCLEVLEQDENILGINLLTMPKEFDREWFPSKDYPHSKILSHPDKYFGTAACLLKKKLLEVVSLEDIIKWGNQQPHTWEVLVSHQPESFLVSNIPTPFGLDLDAWVYQSVKDESFRGIKTRIKYNLGKTLKLLHS